MCGVWGAVAYAAVTLVSGIIDKASQPDPTPPPAPIIQSIQPQLDSAVMYAENANKSAIADYSILEEKANQVNDEYDLKQIEQMRAGLRQAGQLRTRMAAAGIGGNVVDELVGDAGFQAGYDIGIEGQNRINRLGEIDAQRSKVYAENQSRVNQAVSSAQQAVTTQNYQLQAANQSQDSWNRSVGNAANPLMDYLKIGASAVKSGISAYSGTKT